jgi:hypothetical protein
MKEDRTLFARLLVVSRSRPDINFEEAVGKHELSVVPRSMFAADGQMLHRQAKSTLMTILESLPDTTGANEHPNSRVDILELHSLMEWQKSRQWTSQNGWRVAVNLHNISQPVS